MQGTRNAQTTITRQDGYLKAEISGRRTAQQTRDFLRAIVAAAAEYECTRALISVRESNSLFKVEDYGISAYFNLLAANPAYRVALLSDSEEGRIAQEYIALLAHQRGAQVRSFRKEADAVAWLVRD